jgi:hypothetical protein
MVLSVSLPHLPQIGVTGIDASGFGRAHASIHYTKRTNATTQQLKTALLVDTATTTVLNIHLTTTPKYDTQIAPLVVKQTAPSIVLLTGDRGYDNQQRRLAHDHNIRLLIKYLNSAHSTRPRMHHLPLRLLRGSVSGFATARLRN